MVKLSESIELLNNEVSIKEDNGHGAFHIPIVYLETQLDNFYWSTQNYQWNLFKDGYAALHVAASLELVLNFSNDNGEIIKRTFVGACNFALLSLNGIQDWNATAKSLCIKNAASDAGKWLGRGINNEILPDRSDTPKGKGVVQKKEPDSKIMQQFLKAVEQKDEATITLLSNIYQINITDNAQEK